MSNFESFGDYMNKNREKEILEILLKQKNVTVKQLADSLFISEPSIRRDLASLEKQHLIKRIHGGAVLEETMLSKNKIPFSSPDGLHDDMSGDENIGWWTNGFWPGMMWLMYYATRDTKYMDAAQYAEKALDKALTNAPRLDHDAGFMWHLSAGADYRITGNTCI